jgi:hypothetical protein
MLSLWSKGSNFILFHFFYDLFSNSLFFIMSNEIILFQFLYRKLKYLFFSFMKVKIVKVIQCGPCSINGPKFPKNPFKQKNYNRPFDFCHLYILCTLRSKVFVVRILGQKNLFKHSLWIIELFFLRRQILGFVFPIVSKNLKTYSNLTCYA